MMDSLPLDWTRVTRKRPATAVASNTGGVSSSVCCPDPSCRHGRRTATASTSTKKRVYGGQVVVCLHESNPDWFQAYLFLSGGETWGLLGTQQEIDECLQCSEGGYRVVNLQVTTKRKDQPKHTLTDVEWTGGDMMDLKGDDVSMQADKILTGTTAVPVLEGVFGGLVRKIRAETTEPLDEVFPELAIVVGRMEIRLPQEERIDGADDDLMED